MFLSGGREWALLDLLRRGPTESNEGDTEGLGRHDVFITVSTNHRNTHPRKSSGVSWSCMAGCGIGRAPWDLSQ